MKRFLINLLRKFAYVRLLEMYLVRLRNENNRLRRVSNREFGINFNLEQENKKLRLKSLDNWIPVSERLPKYDGEYKCTCRTKDGFQGVSPDVLLVTTMVYVEQKWKNEWFQTVPFYDVIAWQPLPEPYQPKED